MALQDYIDGEVQKVCPIHGISFGKLDDRATWKIHFHDEATDEQRAAAQEALMTIEWNDEIAQAQLDAAKVEQYKNDLTMKQGFMQYKIANPDAKFIDYIKYVESLVIE